MSLRPRPLGVADGESLRALFSRLVEDGTHLVRAEVNYYKQLALHRAADAKTGLIFAGAAVFIAGSALTTLLVGIGLVLARWLGPGLGVVVAAVIAFVIAGVLGWLALKHFTQAATGADEVAAARELRK